ncbi:Sirt2 [Symbiodinium sp. CCMP2456]|nr:Sirt2 [Symbiodinium sp. CCMP2456]
MALQQELLPGKHLPTLTHCFIRLLEEKGLLQRLFTQNIDGLERVCGTSPELLVEAHGSFANAHCVECRQQHDVLRWRDCIVLGQPAYGIGSVNLSERWVDLVKTDKVVAKVTIPSDKDPSHDISVEYGVRLATTTRAVANASDEEELCFEEFVQQSDLPVGQFPAPSELVRSVNEMLSKVSTGGPSVKFGRNGDFTAQLQMVRTLRPAPSPGFAEPTSSIPPRYDSTTDSFVTGPLRLELRPLVATVFKDGSLTTPWDIFHNVSPADTRGHFLLLPTLSDPDKNLRGQIFEPSDCQDMVHLTSSIEPPGSLFLGFNSAGAGASQNHIHCHAWPSPPMSLLHQEEAPVITAAKDEKKEEVENNNGWDSYAATKVGVLYDIYDLTDSRVEASYLKYPVFCVQLCAVEAELDLLGQALKVTLDAVGGAPFNIGFLNRLEEPLLDEGETLDKVKFVDVFVFARSKERSQAVPSLKMGISEMMGVFHAHSAQELELLASELANTVQALKDVSFQDSEALWTSIKQKLADLDRQVAAETRVPKELSASTSVGQEWSTTQGSTKGKNRRMKCHRAHSSLPQNAAAGIRSCACVSIYLGLETPEGQQCFMFGVFRSVINIVFSIILQVHVLFRLSLHCSECLARTTIMTSSHACSYSCYSLLVRMISLSRALIL